MTITSQKIFFLFGSEQIVFVCLLRYWARRLASLLNREVKCAWKKTKKNKNGETREEKARVEKEHGARWIEREKRAGELPAASRISRRTKNEPGKKRLEVWVFFSKKDPLRSRRG